MRVLPMILTDKVNNIIGNEKFKSALASIAEAETGRIYCGHDLTHFLDVARIGMILIHERDLDIAPDVMYGAALTHDLGRAKEYADGTPHEQASVEIAKDILTEAGYADAETASIIMAIETHRTFGSGMPLAEVLYEADKLSRPCYACAAIDTCKWPDEQKNGGVVI